MIEKIINNIDWIFSGIGLAIGAVLLNFIRKLQFSALSKLLARISGYIVSVLRSPDDISKNINIDLRPRHDPLELWLHELPKSQAWLKVANLNPFALALKSISLEIGYGGLVAKAKSDFHNQTIDKYTIVNNVLVEGELTGDQADYIVKYQENPRCRISIKAVFSSPSKEVFYENSWLEGVPVKLVNDQQRKARVLASELANA